MTRQISVSFAGNVVTKPFESVAAKLAAFARVDVSHYPISQIEQALLDERSFNFLIIHTDHRFFFDVAPDRAAIDRMKSFAANVEQRLSRHSGNIVLNTLPYVPVSLVESDLHEQLRIIAELNAVLFDLAKANERISVIDTAAALGRIGFDNAIRERNRHMYQMPYAPAAVDAVTDCYTAAISNYLRARRKVIVLDADNTLWRGVLGEDGADGVAVDLDYPGIIHYRFQQQLLRLQSLGVLLCVVTKNNESDFLEFFNIRKTPLMLENFVAYRSNWVEKSENIRNLAETLNLGLDSFVFIDDNKFEIAEVSSSLPEVECHLFELDAPEKALALLDGISSLRTRSVTKEDLAKTEQYKEEEKRSALQRSSSSMEEFLLSLDLKVFVSHNDEKSLRRITQLSNKTNQFNLTTRRYTEDEMSEAMRIGDVYGFRVVDRFGDMGIVGVGVVRAGEIETFLMSCRALGRKIESQMLRYICSKANGTKLTASYVGTKKNGMVADFFENNGFELLEADSNVKKYRMNNGPEPVPYVNIIDN